eukprot:TRINITY_DN6272_c0_g1_i2.p1 TRINITY_DN6272_c0_g1~~TRINITY_DN6272_c0_g1_i2.p1  ORF type:complete len:207 (+),score=48.27 TRINITY_DN6272_c0_g1_i2:229-849(+)
MAFLATVASWVAIVLGIAAATLLILFFVLRWHVARKNNEARELRRKKKREAAAAAAAAQAADQAKEDAAALASASDALQPGPRRQQAGASTADADRPARRAKVERDPNLLKREQELKRDALHIFRKLRATAEVTEKSLLCREAVALFDSIEKRVGAGMASITSGRIVYCNALMECGGLDELRDCQDTKDPNAAALIERVVPIIFST